MGKMLRMLEPRPTMLSDAEAGSHWGIEARPNKT